MEAAAETRAILIVDDNQPVARALASLVRQAGYPTAVFHLGMAALSYTEQNRPLAAVIDIHLPDISGLDLSQQIRHRLGPHAPIIVVSGDTSMETLNSLSQSGATYFFSKPIRAAHLVERLRELVA